MHMEDIPHKEEWLASVKLLDKWRESRLRELSASVTDMPPALGVELIALVNRHRNGPDAADLTTAMRASREAAVAIISTGREPLKSELLIKYPSEYERDFQRILAKHDQGFKRAVEQVDAQYNQQLETMRSHWPHLKH